MHSRARRQPPRLTGREGKGASWIDRASALVAAIPRASLWRDRVFLSVLAAAILANLALYAYVWLNLPTLPAFLPLRYNATGAVAEIGARVWLLRMPAIGTAILAVNLVLGGALHRRERLAALLLQGITLSVVAMLFLATANIIRLAFGE